MTDEPRDLTEDIILPVSLWKHYRAFLLLGGVAGILIGIWLRAQLLPYVPTSLHSPGGYHYYSRTLLDLLVFILPTLLGMGVGHRIAALIARRSGYRG